MTAPSRSRLGIGCKRLCIGYNIPMSDEDFDIDRLAAFLHLSPQQVTRLADRGKIPARKIGGQWRFAGADVHHWLEERIGLSDDVELQQVEGALDRSAPEHEAAPNIAAMLPPAAIAVPLEGKSRNKVITAMVETAAATGMLWDPDRLAEAVRAREDMHPTALESGVALLHPRRPMANILEEPFLAFGRTVQGVPFGGSRGVLTDLFFLILSTDDRGHLRTLARLSRMLGDATFLSELRAAPNAAAVQEIIARREEGVQ
jgi:PTS system nitrogen regulatory IIA component